MPTSPSTELFFSAFPTPQSFRRVLRGDFGANDLAGLELSYRSFPVLSGGIVPNLRGGTVLLLSRTKFWAFRA